jgi:ABC-type transport system involved in multi-copper enzyme maturation permease subunit
MNVLERTVWSNPVLRHELRSLTRLPRQLSGSRRLRWLAALLLAWSFGMLLFEFGYVMGDRRHPDDSFFQDLAFACLALTMLLAPVQAAGAIAGERQRNTWEMLLTTPLTPREILGGKYLGRLLNWACYLALSLPFLVEAAWHAEHPGLLWLIFWLVLPPTYLGLSALGLLCSARSRTAAQARVLAVSWALALVGGVPLAETLWNSLVGGSGDGYYASFVTCPPMAAAAMFERCTFVPDGGRLAPESALAWLMPIFYLLLAAGCLLALTFWFNRWLRSETVRPAHED